MASEYVLSARLKVEGGRDFVDDLERAERAARDASESFRKLKALNAEISLRGARDFEDDATRAALAVYDLDDALEKLKAQSSAISLDGAAKFVRQLDEVQLAIIKAKDYFDEFNRDPLHLGQIAGIDKAVADLKDLRTHADAAVKALQKLRDLELDLDVRGADNAIADIARVEEVAQRMVRTFNDLENDPLNLSAIGVAELRSDLELADAAAQGLDRALRNINTAKLRDATDETGKLGAAMASLGRGLAYSAMDRVFDTIADGAADAAREVVALDEKLKNALSITAPGTDLGKLEGEMKSLARSISKDLGTPVSEVANGFYDLISAGLTMDEVMAGIEPAARFAKGGLIDLEDAVHKGAQAFAIFKDAANEAGGTGYSMQQIFDALAQASNVSQGDIDTFADALTNKAGTAAYNFGQTLETTLGVLAAFHERGVEGKVAGEQYSIVLRDMRIKALQNEDAFKKLGIAVFDQKGEMRQLTDIIPDVQSAFAGLSDKQAQAELAALGFTLRSQNVILSMIGMGDRAVYFKDKMLEAGGAVDRMVEIQLTSLQSMLDRLRAYTIDLAISGLDKLFEAGAFLRDTFAPALDAIAPAAAAFARGIGDVVSAIAPLIAGAVIGGIQGIALAVEAVGNFASQHLGAVQTFGELLAMIAVGGAAAYLAGPLLTGFANIAGAAKLGYTAVRDFVIEMLTVRNTGTYLDALKAGWQGLGDMIRSNPTVAIGVFVAAMAGMANEVRKNQKDAEDFANAIKSAYDTTTTGGMAAATEHLRAQAEQARQAASETRGFGDFLKTTADIIPFIDFSDTSIDLYDAAEAAERMATEMSRVATESNGVINSLADWSSGFGIQGPILGDVDEVRSRIQQLGKDAGIASGDLTITADKLRDIARANDIDLSGPWREWLPLLFDAAVAQGEMSGSLQRLGVDARTADQLAEDFAGGLDDMGASAADAAEQFDALVEAMNGLMDGPLSQFDATTKAAEATQALNKAWGEFGLTTDAASEGGRAVRDALVEWVGAQRDLNEAMNAGDSLAYAEGVGRIREELVIAAQNMGFTVEQANALADSLGLIPEEKAVEIAATVTGDEEAAAALDAAAEGRETTITAEAEMALAQSDLAGLTSEPRTARIDTDADTAPADTKINEVATRPRVATVLTEAQVAGAEVALAALAVARTVVFSAVSDGSSANINAGFDYAARARDAVIAASDYGTGAQVNAGLDYAARYRQAYIDVMVNTYNRIINEGGGSMYNWADGGVVEYYAGGGMRENHVAQFAPAGAWRVWAEPETGGEAYIPLHPGKRNRSLEVWKETGKRLGVQGFAEGGMVAQSAARVAAMNGGGGVSVVVSPGAIQANVSAAVNADPDALAAKIRDAMGPALDEFALNLTTAIRRRG